MDTRQTALLTICPTNCYFIDLNLCTTSTTWMFCLIYSNLLRSLVVTHNMHKSNDISLVYSFNIISFCSVQDSHPYIIRSFFCKRRKCVYVNSALPVFWAKLRQGYVRLADIQIPNKTSLFSCYSKVLGLHPLRTYIGDCKWASLSFLSLLSICCVLLFYRLLYLIKNNILYHLFFLFSINISTMLSTPSCAPNSVLHGSLLRFHLTQ